MIGRFLFIAGGDDGERHFAEVFALDTDSLKWECIIDWRETGLRGDLADSDGATAHGLNLDHDISSFNRIGCFCSNHRAQTS